MDEGFESHCGQEENPVPFLWVDQLQIPKIRGLLLEICVGLGWEQLGVKGENHFSHYPLHLSQVRNVPTFFFSFSKPHISAKIVKWQR